MTTAPENDGVIAAEHHDARLAALIVRISSAQKRMAENFTAMAERLVELAEAQADAHRATEELAALIRSHAKQQ